MARIRVPGNGDVVGWVEKGGVHRAVAEDLLHELKIPSVTAANSVLAKTPYIPAPSRGVLAPAARRHHPDLRCRRANNRFRPSRSRSRLGLSRSRVRTGRQA